MCWCSVIILLISFLDIECRNLSRNLNRFFSIMKVFEPVFWKLGHIIQQLHTILEIILWPYCLKKKNCYKLLISHINDFRTSMEDFFFAVCVYNVSECKIHIFGTKFKRLQESRQYIPCCIMQRRVDKICLIIAAIIYNGPQINRS